MKFMNLDQFSFTFNYLFIQITGTSVMGTTTLRGLHDGSVTVASCGGDMTMAVKTLYVTQMQAKSHAPLQPKY